MPTSWRDPERRIGPPVASQRAVASLSAPHPVRPRDHAPPARLQSSPTEPLFHSNPFRGGGDPSPAAADASTSFSLEKPSSRARPPRSGPSSLSSRSPLSSRRYDGSSCGAGDPGKV